MTAETVKLTLEVPRGVIDFVSDLFRFSGGKILERYDLDKE